ncbi:MAG: hypothetical protein Q7R74_00265, partial [bacterium]|nr:hypothetical protein [bacterium]
MADDVQSLDGVLQSLEESLRAGETTAEQAVVLLGQNPALRGALTANAQKIAAILASSQSPQEKTRSLLLLVNLIRVGIPGAVETGTSVRPFSPEESARLAERLRSAFGQAVTAQANQDRLTREAHRAFVEQLVNNFIVQCRRAGLREDEQKDATSALRRDVDAMPIDLSPDEIRRRTSGALVRAFERHAVAEPNRASAETVEGARRALEVLGAEVDKEIILRDLPEILVENAGTTTSPGTLVKLVVARASRDVSTPREEAGSLIRASDAFGLPHEQARDLIEEGGGIAGSLRRAGMGPSAETLENLPYETQEAIIRAALAQSLVPAVSVFTERLGEPAATRLGPAIRRANQIFAAGASRAPSSGQFGPIIQGIATTVFGSNNPNIAYLGLTHEGILGSVPMAGLSWQHFLLASLNRRAGIFIPSIDVHGIASLGWNVVAASSGQKAVAVGGLGATPAARRSFGKIFATLLGFFGIKAGGSAAGAAIGAGGGPVGVVLGFVAGSVIAPIGRFIGGA